MKKTIYPELSTFPKCKFSGKACDKADMDGYLSESCSKCPISKTQETKPIKD